MTIRKAREGDFVACVAIARRAWPEFHERESIYHLFCKFFSDTCFVAEADGAVGGFLLGFVSQVDPEEAYIHLVAVDPPHQRRGLARRLYEAFLAEARGRGVRRVRLIVNPDNAGSIAFHEDRVRARPPRRDGDDRRGPRRQGLQRAGHPDGAVPPGPRARRARPMSRPPRGWPEWLSDTFAQIGLCIAAIVVAVRAYIEGNVETALFLQLILWLVFAVVTYLVVKGIRDESDRREIRALADSVGRLGSPRSECDLRLVECPRRTADYKALWGGFTGDYFAFNPAYKLEESAGVSLDTLLREVFIPRFRDPSFRSSYIFLVGDESGREALEYFRKLAAGVRRACHDAEKRIEVKVIDRPAEDDCEIYLGTKHGRPTSIVEPREKALSVGRGSPYFYLVVAEAEDQDHVYTRLHNYFNAHWTARDAMKVNVFDQASSIGRAPSP